MSNQQPPPEVLLLQQIVQQQRLNLHCDQRAQLNSQLQQLRKQQRQLSKQVAKHNELQQQLAQMDVRGLAQRQLQTWQMQHMAIQKDQQQQQTLLNQLQQQMQNELQQLRQVQFQHFSQQQLTHQQQHLDRLATRQQELHELQEQLDKQAQDQQQQQQGLKQMERDQQSSTAEPGLQPSQTRQVNGRLLQLHSALMVVAGLLLAATYLAMYVSTVPEVAEDKPTFMVMMEFTPPPAANGTNTTNATQLMAFGAAVPPLPGALPNATLLPGAVLPGAVLPGSAPLLANTTAPPAGPTLLGNGTVLPVTTSGNSAAGHADTTYAGQREISLAVQMVNGVAFAGSLLCVMACLTNILCLCFIPVVCGDKLTQADVDWLKRNGKLLDANAERMINVTLSVALWSFVVAAFAALFACLLAAFRMVGVDAVPVLAPIVGVPIAVLCLAMIMRYCLFRNTAFMHPRSKHMQRLQRFCCM